MDGRLLDSALGFLVLPLYQGSPSGQSSLFSASAIGTPPSNRDCSSPTNPALSDLRQTSHSLVLLPEAVVSMRLARATAPGADR